MILSEVITDLKLDGALSHKNYQVMVNTWKNPNQSIPTLEECLEVWDNTSSPRLAAQRKQERILEVKSMANEILRLEHDWKVAKQYTTEYWTPEEFFIIKQEMQAVRDKSNQIENEILALTTLEEVNNYNINFND
jgi:hypothetical protein